MFFRITYHPDCTFTVAIDGGVTMDSATGTGATIPPGPYSISVRTPLPDDTWNPSICTTAKFSLTGPGVSYAAILGNDLGPYGATFNPSFAPASTYTIVDGNQPIPAGRVHDDRDRDEHLAAPAAPGLDRDRHGIGAGAAHGVRNRPLPRRALRDGGELEHPRP